MTAIDPVPPRRSGAHPAAGLITRAAFRGLFFLRAATDPRWSPRRQLILTLGSTTWAEQSYDIDIDVNAVRSLVPAELLPETGSTLWVPILRIPANWPNRQRISRVADAGGRLLPLMPQTEVKRYLSAALAWLTYSLLAGPGAAERPPGEQRQILRETQLLYLAYLDGAPVDTLRLPADRDLEGAIRRIIVQGLTVTDPAQQELAHAIRYVSAAYFAVVGLDPTAASSSVHCELLPLELEVHTHLLHPVSSRQVFGFDIDGNGEGPPARLRDWFERSLMAVTRRPSVLQLEIPLPELVDDQSTHVRVMAHPDVAIDPAVLLHDVGHPVDGGSGRAPVSQGRMLEPGAAPASEVEDVARRLIDLADEGRPAPPQLVRQLATELRSISARWRLRRERSGEVRRLFAERLHSQPSEPLGWSGPPGRWRRRPTPWPRPSTPGPTPGPRSNRRCGPGPRNWPIWSAGTSTRR